MGSVKQYKITWTKSPSGDVVGYNIYYVPEGDILNYGSPHVSVGDVDTILIPTDTPEFPFIDGVYQIGLAAVDDVGNMSDIIAKTVPFDLIVPDVPSGLEITPV